MTVQPWKVASWISMNDTGRIVEGFKRPRWAQELPLRWYSRASASPMPPCAQLDRG